MLLYDIVTTTMLQHQLSNIRLRRHRRRRPPVQRKRRVVRRLLRWWLGATRAWVDGHHSLRSTLQGEFKLFVDAVQVLRVVQLNLSALEAFAIASNFSALGASFSRTEFTGGDAERYAIHGQLWAEFLERGYYAQILLDWLSAFGKRNVLVIDANRWGSHSAQQLIEFLDLPTERYPWIQEQQQRAYAPLNTNTVVGLEGISPGDLITLKHLYADHNHWLRKLTRIRLK